MTLASTSLYAGEGGGPRAAPEARRPLDAAGAPFDQGVTQGLTGGAEIRRSVVALREVSGWLAGRELRSALYRQPGLRMRRHLTHQYERLEGIAAGAGVTSADLTILDAIWRTRGVGSISGSELELRLDPPDEMRPTLILRQLAPDSVGFRSVEVACLPLPGCIAGVNERGIGVAVLEDQGPVEVPLRSLAQDLLYHAASLDAACAHLETRARYAGGTGALVVADATGRAVRVELRAGACHTLKLEPTPPPRETTVRIDLISGRIALVDPEGVQTELTIRQAAARH